MKAGAEEITFCEKHKRHSKTLRKERMLKQDENALKISRRTKHLCYPVSFFVYWRKYPEYLACYCALPEEKSTNIQEYVHVYFGFQIK